MLPEKFLTQFAARLSRETGSPTTHAEAEAEAVRILGVVSRWFGIRRFGYFDGDDIAQEASIMGLELIAKDKYEGARPLENYLVTHIDRRLQNLKRDKFFRREAPCRCCDPFDPGANPCKRWQQWNELTQRKMSLMGSGPDPENIRPRVAQHEERELLNEIDEWIDETWPAALRADYMRLKQGVGLTASRTKAVKDRILVRFGEDAHAD